jgi:hypothetical protein
MKTEGQMQARNQDPNFEVSYPSHVGYPMKGLHWHKLKQIYNNSNDL